MPVFTPGRHPAYEPIGRLRSSPFSGGKKSGFMELNLTAMVDMFTVIVIFLLQTFSGEGEVSVHKNLTLPDSEKAKPLSERGPIIVVMRGEVLLDGDVIASLDDESSNEPGIPPLTERLVAVKEANDKIEQELRRRDPSRPVKPFDGNLIVQADEETDFKLVRRAIFSANEAGWVHLQFAVTKVIDGKHDGDVIGTCGPDGDALIYLTEEDKSYCLDYIN
jgi:biopolymer transport protein ExbD